MKPSRLLTLLVPGWFCFAGCAGSDVEPPLTPASYPTPKASQAPPRAKRADARPAQKAKAKAETPAPLVTGIEGGDSRTAIAMARCEREARCGNVGPEKDYETEDDCVSRLEPDTERELEAQQCPSNIAAEPLKACLLAIRKQSCNRPLGDLAPLGECSAAALCQG